MVADVTLSGAAVVPSAPDVALSAVAAVVTSAVAFVALVVVSAKYK